jgi:precorrin-3B synthase
LNPRSVTAPVRPSACPALSRIVAARDGGLCRVKLPGGELHAMQARAIAAAAAQYGSGVIELTNRANLQLRGVRPGAEAALTDALLRAGLGPQPGARSAAGDAPGACATMTLAAADDVRNLMVSPLAGRDADALDDTRRVAAQLLDMLQSEPRFAQLSPKFALMLDGGERLMMLDHAHDLWFSAISPREGTGGTQAGPQATSGEVRYAIGLAGSPAGARCKPLATVSADEIPAVAHALVHAFLDLAAPDETRMRDLLDRCSAHGLLKHASGLLGRPLALDGRPVDWRRREADALVRFGAHRQRADALWYVGAQPPLGRIDAQTLVRLAALVDGLGTGTLHVTPWQGIVVPDIPESQVKALHAALAADGFIVDASDPLAHLIACAGSSGCAKGRADTKRDARLLARELAPAVAVHLTGCPRACAAAHCAPYTLLAVEPGRYDLYRRIDCADTHTVTADTPHENADVTARFGARVGTHLTIEEAAAQLRTSGPTRSGPDA